MLDSFRPAKYCAGMSKTLSDLAATRLRAVMAEERVSAAELARRLAVSNPYVWRRMHGATSLSMAELERIAAALNIPVARLIPEPIEVAS